MARLAYCGQYSSAVLSNSPYAYYRLDESPGNNIAADQGSGANSGTYTNSPTRGASGALQNDPTDTAAAFNRTGSQYLQLTTMGNLGVSLNSGFTLEYWLKTSDGTDYQSIMGSVNAATSTDFIVDLNYSGNSDMLRLYFRGDDGNRLETQLLTTTPGNINIFNNAWHYIAQVYDPTTANLSDRIKFYVDGALQTTTPFGTGNPVAGNFSGPLTLAATNDRGSVGNYLSGGLDEVAIYKTALAPGTISNHFAASVPEPIGGLQLMLGAGALLGSSRVRRPSK